MRMHRNPLPVLVLVATLLFAVSPMVSSGFNGFDPMSFPVPQIDPPVQPAGYAFAIWGLIYLWLIAGALYGLVNAATSLDWRDMRRPLMISLLIGVFWISVANTSPVWATVMITLMAASAIWAFLKAGRSDPLFQVWPVALYAGWLTAATGVGCGVVLAGYGVFSPQVAALFCLSAVLVVALIVQSMRPRDPGYPASVAWALAGIIVANSSTQNWPVITLAVIGMALLLGRAVVHQTKAI